MSRLPIPGQDSGTWGDILNDYLSQSLKPDGTLQDNSVTSNAVAPNSITNAQIASDAVNAASIADGSITNSLIADGTIQEVKLSSTVQTKLNQTAPVTSVNTKTGAVTLDKADIGLGNVDDTSDATKNAATATLTNKTLTNPQINKISDTNGNTSIQLNATASAVNYLYVVNSATGNSISFRANGTDTNIPIGMFSKGTGQVQLRSDTNGFILSGDSVASGVNYVGLTNAATGTGPTITSTGSDTNVDLNITAKGTGNLNIPRGTGLSQYNTADQTTNYERVRQYWSGNVFYLYGESGGTGTARPIRIISGNATFGINELTQSLVFTRNTPSVVSTLFDLTTSGTGLSGTGGSQYGVRIIPTINQSSTAGYTMLLINPTETATGSGAKLLADFQVGGTSKTRIDNTGSHYLSSGATIVSYNTTDETTNYERVQQYWNGNVYTIQTAQGGTGTQRPIYISGTGSSNAGLRLNVGSASGLVQSLMTISTAGAIAHIINGTWSASSGTQTGLSISPTINQSSTAGYTTLLVNPTETATGSGAKRLLDLQVGGTTKFNVDNTGVATVAAVGSTAGSLVSVDGTQTLTNKTINGSNNTLSNIAQSAVTNLTSDLTNKQAKFMTGTSSTAATTQAKIVTLDSPWSSYVPVAGDLFLITFTSGINVNNPTLNVNSQGAKTLGSMVNTDQYTTYMAPSSYSVLLQYNGTDFRSVSFAAQYNEITAAEVIDTTHSGLRTITGRRLETLMANEATKSRTLQYKNITRSSLNLNSDANDYTHLPFMMNDLGYLTFRAGGAVTWTLNGVAQNHINIGGGNAFTPDSSYLSLNGLTSTDVFIAEVTLPTDASWTYVLAGGIEMTWNYARDVTIEVYNGTSWATMLTITGSSNQRQQTNPSTNGVLANGTAITKIRWTITNFSNATFRILSLWAMINQSKLLGRNFLALGGGQMYGIIQHKTYTTAGRPSASTSGAGAEYFDTTLNKPVYSDGTNWRDATGTIV